MNITFENISIKSLLAMGDHALLDGNRQLAIAIYERILRETPESSRSPIVSRIGLAKHPKPRTPILLQILKLAEEIDPANAFVSDGLAMWFKNQYHSDDKKFTELADKHTSLLPVPNWHWNLGTIIWAIKQVEALPGDFVELGVFKGHTTLFAAEYFNFSTSSRRWFLYDTFDGIPDDQLDAGWQRTNNIYKGTFSYEEVKSRFSSFNNIEVIKGRVPEILAVKSPDNIAFVHVDLNNASAEISALDCLFDRIVPGGVIVFDDYAWAVSKAQYRAELEWFSSRNLVILPLPTGQGVFVKK